MELIHNRLIKILTPRDAGIYRVIHSDHSRSLVSLVCIDEFERSAPDRPQRGRKPKQASEERKTSQIGTLHWLDATDLQRRSENSEVLPFEEKTNFQLLTPISERDGKILARRVEIMRGFLHFPTLQEELLAYRSLTPMMKRVCEQHKVSQSLIFKLWSQLCLYGFTESSLRPRFFRCGAPGVKRPCDPGGKKKAGAKTAREKLAKRTGADPGPGQLGISTEWRQRILAADRTLPRPRPKMPERCLEIQRRAFAIQGRADEHGSLTIELPAKGQYPNLRQIRRVLETEIPKLEQILIATTQGHFLRTRRGMKGKAWQGASGPNHMWAIDSTIGDVYLRSAINRAWIIGRPIVYILVDVWSTSVIGFFVCLAGPSWDMAKQALFSASIRPELLGEIWGYQPVLSLNPAPTLCSTLLCDRGEYLSQAGRQTSLELLHNQSFTPPYRPDLKSLAEVLHRIEKDQQFTFLPGAIDARRHEYDLRKFDPRAATFTIRSYTQYLHYVFSEYNLTADRSHRLDAGMVADSVFPSPAGLWAWGHTMGIGVQRELPEAHLIQHLLPAGMASVTRSGFRFGGLEYQSPLLENLDWHTLARNVGSWEFPINYFSGSMQQIWTPNPAEGGMLALQLSDHGNAPQNIALEEWVDVLAYQRLKRADIEHLRAQQHLALRQKRHDLIAQESRLTEQACLLHEGPQPTLTEARQIEKIILPSGYGTGHHEPPAPENARDPGLDDHLATLTSVLNAALGDEK